MCYDNFKGFNFMDDNLSAKIMKFMSSNNICTYNSLLIWIDQTQILVSIINTATPMGIVTCTWNYSTHVHTHTHAKTRVHRHTHIQMNTHAHRHTHTCTDRLTH